MKNLILIFCLWAAFASCSDDETKTEETDPFLPVTALEIPKKQLLGEEITLRGKGFASDCKIQLQLNGGDIFDTEIVTASGDSVVIKTPELKSGFYIVLLTQGGETYRIGAINLVAESLQMDDIEALGVVGEEGFNVYPVSISNKLKGDRLFSSQMGHVFYGGVIHQGIWYYATYYIKEIQEGYHVWTERHFVVYAYDPTAGTNEVLIEDIQSYVAMGVIDGELCIFTYDDNNCYIEKLENGVFNRMITFPNAVGITEKIVINDGIFLQDVLHNALIMAGYDMTGNTRKFVWAVSLSDLQVKEVGNALSTIFHLVNCEGKFYAFAENADGDGVTDISVVRLQDPTDWVFDNLTPEAVMKKSAFNAPVYDKKKKVIYGIDDGETVVTYDIATKQIVGGKWVKSGLISLFLLNQE